MNTPSNETCAESVSWWEGEYEGSCELPEGHQGPHYDGISCFTDDGEEVELKSKPIPPMVITISYQRQGVTQYRQSLVIRETSQLITFQPEAGVNILAEITQ